MKDEAGVGFFNVKAVAIMRDDDVSFIIELPKLLNEVQIIFSVPPEFLEIGKRYSVNFFVTEPLIGERQNIPTSLNID